MRSSLLASVAVSTAALAALAGGCKEGKPARPGEDLPPPGTYLEPPAPAVGPAPLRRLSNAEYLNALHDLFPSVSPALPPLPQDVPVAGFENAAEGQEPSDVLIARYEAIANLYAQAIAPDTASVQALVGCSDWSTPALATTCATQLLEQTGKRIFRRPLTSAEEDRFLARFQAWQAAVDFEGAAQLTLSALLQSPQFLYRAEPLPAGAALGSVAPVEAYAMASRLSFFLWESLPDDALLDAASRDELATEAQVRAQAARMLADERAKRVFWSFHRQWLGLDRILLPEHLTRTPQVDPDWTAATQASASFETQLFVQNVVGAGGTFEDLLTSTSAWVDGEMSRVYGLPVPADPTAWERVTLPADERAGLLTRASFLAGFSHAGATSPPVRGNGIELRLLCSLPMSPPPGANLTQPTPAPGSGPQTNRMLFEQRTSPALCQTCHEGLNGFGFGLESYNAAGHFQTTDDGLPVDATGSIHGTDVDGPFVGGVALSQALAKSAVVHTCAAQSWVRYALGRAPTAIEAPTVSGLAASFLASGGDVRALMTDIVASPSFRLRRVEDD